MAMRAVVSSIPKSGKNLIISFFDALNLVRLADERMLTEAAAHMQARWLSATLQARWREETGTLESPDIPLTPKTDAYIAETRPPFEALLASVATLPDGTYIHGHFGFDHELHATARAAGVPLVFVYRDPRGCLASMAHFLVDRGEPADLLPWLTRRDLPTALQLFLDGHDVTLPFHEMLAPYLGWLGAEGVLALRFEDLIGPHGGGSVGRQRAALTALARHIGWGGSTSSWEGSTAELLHAVQQTFNPRAGTFRRGRIDGWRDDIAPWIFERYPAALVDLPRAWGYSDEPEPAEPPLVESGLMAMVDLLLAELAARQEAQAAVERDNVERLALAQKHQDHLATLQDAYDTLAADNDARLALVQEHQDHLATLQAAYDALAADNDARLALVQKHQAELAALTAAYEALAADSDERLAVIHTLTARLQTLTAAYEALAADSDERLAVIHTLTTRLQALTADHTALAAEHETLTADYEALKAEHGALTAAHATLAADHAALDAAHAERRAAWDTLRQHPVLRILGPRPGPWPAPLPTPERSL